MESELEQIATKLSQVKFQLISFQMASELNFLIREVIYCPNLKGFTDFDSIVIGRSSLQQNGIISIKAKTITNSYNETVNYTHFQQTCPFINCNLEDKDKNMINFILSSYYKIKERRSQLISENTKNSLLNLFYRENYEEFIQYLQMQLDIKQQEAILISSNNYLRVEAEKYLGTERERFEQKEEEEEEEEQKNDYSENRINYDATGGNSHNSICEYWCQCNQLEEDHEHS